MIQLETRSTAMRNGYQPHADEIFPNSITLTRAQLSAPILESDWPRFRGEFLDTLEHELPDRFPNYAEAINTGIVIRRKDVSLPSTLSLIDFENLVAPAVAVLPQRPVALVPIRPPFARGLIETEQKQLELMPLQEVSLFSERAYFFQAGHHAIVPAGGLVVFYVSGEVGAAVGLARITYSDTLGIGQVYPAFARQGVLSRTDLEVRGGPQGKVTVFTFDHFLQFPIPVPFQSLKEIGCIGATNLISAENVSIGQLTSIIAQGWEIQ